MGSLIFQLEKRGIRDSRGLAPAIASMGPWSESRTTCSKNPITSSLSGTKEIRRRQSMYTGLLVPEVNVNGS